MLVTVSCNFEISHHENFLTFPSIATLFLCSKEARWITGLIMPVDAGVNKSLP